MKKPRRDDVKIDRKTLPLTGHKLGGRPSPASPLPRRLSGALDKLLDGGAIQVLQLDFPSPSDPGLLKIDRTWPFGMGTFHLLRHAREWQCFWSDE